MLSSVGDLNEIKTIKDAGIDVYLTKPVREAEFINCLTALIQSEPIAPPTAANPIEQELKLNTHILLAEDNFTILELVSRGMRKPTCSNLLPRPTHQPPVDMGEPASV